MQKTQSPAGAPVAETFERELELVREKEKDLKGEQRKFFSSIVERVKNNVDVLATLREEHTVLRAKLNKLVIEKRDKLSEPDLETALKHRRHEVNFLTKQIDMLTHKKEEAINRQKELEIILANFQNAAETPHPEIERIRIIKNKLDKANIKNTETKHLVKIYQGIINQFDKQQMLWNPLVQEQQQEIEKKHRDISELTLIARDSKHSKATARTEFLRTQQQCNIAQKKRDQQLKTKKKQLIEMGPIESVNTEQYGKPSKTQQSLNSQPSQLRNKMNKQMREKKEEKLRQVTAVYEKIRDAFGTNDPQAIAKYFNERRDTSAALTKQIDDLRKDSKQLKKQIDRLKVEIEEQEFTTARGVGSHRMMAEGASILQKNEQKLRKNHRKVEAFDVQRKQICAGISHFLDILGLVTPEGEELPKEFPEILDWATEKASYWQKALDEEDVAYTNDINMQVYMSYKQRNGDIIEEEVKKPKRDNAFKRTRDQKGDVVTRVLDRAAVKAAAQKAMQQAAQQKRPVRK